MDISYKDLIAPPFYGLWNDVVNRKYPEIWLAGGRGCVDGDTPIDTPQGSIPIRQFGGGEVFSLDHKGRVVVTIACKPIQYTKESLYRVVIGDTSILVTDEHRFLTPSGWKPLKSLSEGDHVAFVSPSDYQRSHSPTSALGEQTAAACVPLSRACIPPLSSVSSQVRRDGDVPCRTYDAESPVTMHGDALHWWRTLLGWIYHYWQDYHLCDGRPPREGETFLDVFLQLADALEHSHVDLHTDVPGQGREYSRCAPQSVHPSKRDYLRRGEGRCCEGREIETLQRLSEWLFQTAPSRGLSQQSEALVDNMRQVVGLVLSSISHLDSLAADPCESDVSGLPRVLKGESTLQRLFDMLRHTVHDESYSNSFLIEDDEFYRTHHYTIFQPIKSIAFEKDDFYYDMFVPIYNNYISCGIVNHNSTKSSFVSTCIPLLMEMNPKVHCVCFRKFGTNLADSVYAQLEFTINEKLRPIADHWLFKRSPLKIVNTRTNQQILFRGLDDPQKVKSLKAPFGYFGLIWIEELAEFDGIEEVRNVLQSLRRGGHYFQTFASYNPPETSANWVNYEASVPQIVDGRLYRYVHHSDYRGVPRHWLGDDFFISAELLRQSNERAYRHEYLGEVTGNGGAVFPNVVPLEMSDEMIATFDSRRFGLDFGFALDPLHYSACHYDKKHRDLYIFDEINELNCTNIALAELLKAKRDEIGFNYIMCDAAEPKSIAELEGLGVNALAAQKGPDSRRFSYRFLQSLAHIYIDPKRCPKTYESFVQCEYLKNKAGQFISRYPENGGDDPIDSVRYAIMEDAIDAGLF